MIAYDWNFVHAYTLTYTCQRKWDQERKTPAATICALDRGDANAIRRSEAERYTDLPPMRPRIAFLSLVPSVKSALCRRLLYAPAAMGRSEITVRSDASLSLLVPDGYFSRPGVLEEQSGR